MAITGFQTSTAQFNRALTQYMQVTRRNAKEALNKKAKDVVLRTVSRIPRADRSEIRGLVEKEWWPKYVAKAIHRLGFTMTRPGKLLKGGKGRKRRRGPSRTFTLKGTYTVAQARMVSREIIGRRSRGVGFLRHAVLESGKAFGVAGRGQSMTNARGEGFPATFYQLRAKLVQAYVSKRPGTHAAAAKRIVEDAILWALQFVARDMEKYLADKQREAAARVSGRRR